MTDLHTLSTHAGLHIFMDPKQAAQTITAYRNLVSPEDQIQFFGLVLMNVAAFWDIVFASVGEPARTTITAQLAALKATLEPLTGEPE